MSIRSKFAVSVCAAVLLAGGAAQAESLRDAMISAYQKNPTLNAARASLRASDEAVPQALSSYRPKVSVFAGLNAATTEPGSSGVFTGSQYIQGGLQVTHTLYSGGKTEASTASAEASVAAARAQLRSSEQTVLQQAVDSYVNVIQAGALLKVQESNVSFLTEQVKAAQDKLTVGQGTQTDVAQAKAQLASGQASLIQAQSALKSANAVYAQVVGHAAKGIGAVSADGVKLPANLEAALQTARAQHPSIEAAAKNVAIAEANVDVQSAGLKPSVTMTGQAYRNAGHGTSTSNAEYNQGSVTASISIPVYEGGAVWSAVRQAKETLEQRKLELDAARMQVDASLISAWGNLEAARGSVASGVAGVSSAKLALDGVVAQQQVGQKTTLDVLNAQITSVSAQTALVTAQRNLISYTYQVVGATGHLSATDLNLPVPAYDPAQHYTEVHDQWFGLRASANNN